MLHRLFASVLFLAVLPAAAIDVQAPAAAVDARVLAWRRDLHQHPELGNRETRTSSLVVAHLRSLGLEPQRGIAFTGVTALIRGGRPGPRIALRADMDALPVTERVDLPFASRATADFRGQQVGVMHACGHDAHTAILMGVAEVLVGMREQLAGEVLFVFQPAEEGPPDGELGGATLMLDEGLFAGGKPQAMFGLHVFSTLNVGQIGVRPGPLMAASDRFTIRVRGRQTHGSRPWGGVDPVVVAAELIGSAQQIVSREMNISRWPVVVTFGAIHGGVRYNIIPDEVTLEGTIRTFDEAMRADVYTRLRRVADHTAAAHGASVTHAIPVSEADPRDLGNPVTMNDPALTAKVLPLLQSVVGAENVVDPGLTMGAEDFAYYAREVPATFFFIGATPRGTDPSKAPSNHSPEFFLDEEALRIGTRALLAVALGNLTAP
ncbi:MAG: amidohydrolase [Xanthomonadales bacterium]|nr:amidohydrolase [Xanthomonadales bacterium]